MSIEPMSYARMKAGLESDRATSFWLREALAALERRDPVDAVSDASILAIAARKRFEEVIAQAQSNSSPGVLPGSPD